MIHSVRRQCVIKSITITKLLSRFTGINKIVKKSFPRHENRFLHTMYIDNLSVSLCPSQSIVNLRLQLLRIPLTVIVRISHDPRTTRTRFGKRRKRKLYSQTVNAAAIRTRRFVFPASSCVGVFHVLFFIYNQNPSNDV